MTDQERQRKASSKYYYSHLEQCRNRSKEYCHLHREKRKRYLRENKWKYKSWSIRNCSICGRFVPKKGIEFCSKCAKERALVRRWFYTKEWREKND